MKKPMENDAFTPAFWLRTLTSEKITAQQIAVVENCAIKKARGIVVKVNGGHKKGADYVCATDAYLKVMRGTTRERELKTLYGKL